MTITGWMLRDEYGKLWGTEHSWCTKVPIPFLTRAGAERNKHLGKVVKVSLTWKVTG